MRKANNPVNPPQKSKEIPKLKTDTILGIMKDGREFESILNYDISNINIADELKKSIMLISEKRKRPVVCYIANSINPRITQSTSIDQTDDLPFFEMISSIPKDCKEIDIILITPGGSGQQVSKFVDKLRPRFDKVSFILPNSAMSAGTIFAMSGDEIIMSNNAYIGPIDPQVIGRDGRFVPAQSLLKLIKEIQDRGHHLLSRGQQPPWTDLQILNNIDSKEIGNAITASDYSIKLVTSYLYNFKFKDWNVEDELKQSKADEIAKKLCDHSLWKSHGHGITRDVAENECGLKIGKTEDFDIDSDLRKFWALTYWIFENTNVYKIFVSNNYTLFRADNTAQK